MVLNFSYGTVVVMCPFETYDGGTLNAGDGLSPGTSVALFGFLNQDIVDVDADVNGKLIFEFGPGRGLRIIPGSSGYELYVLKTPNGVYPVY